MYHPFASMTACTRSGIDFHSLELLGGNFFPIERKNFRQCFLHLPRGTRVVANSGIIDVRLSFEENPGVLNRIEVRGVRRMGLKGDIILLEEGEHELCSVYARVVLLK